MSRGETLVSDAALGDAATVIGCRLAASKAVLHQSLILSLRTNSSLTKTRSDAIQKIRTRMNILEERNIDSRFAVLQEKEAALNSFFKTDSKETAELQKDAIGQLSFQDAHFKSLNQVPFALFAIAIFKIWVVPSMAIIMPLLAWLLPFFILRYVVNLPIEQEHYFEIMRHLWSGSLPTPPYGFSDKGLPALPSLWTPRSIAQGCFFLFSFAQGLVQPVMNALHLYKMDSTFIRLGQDIQAVCQLARELCDELEQPSSPLINDFQGLDARQTFCLAQDQPFRLTLIFEHLGRLEVLWCLSKNTRFSQCEFSDTGVFHLKAVTDISIPAALASTLTLSPTTPHAILTGPNGGGKSSSLRSILQSVLFGLSYGYIPASFGILPRFRWVASGLQLRDSPGRLSMFETEVQFAAKTLSRPVPRGAKALVLFDELFHSTNPPDADRTAELFLRALWNRDGICSIVSTHNFGLIDRAPSNVTPLCCPAEELPGGDIRYKYYLHPGVCTVSSVKNVWNRFGLTTSAAAYGSTISRGRKE